MAAGDVTSTYEGAFQFNSAALLVELDTLSTGATTAGGDLTSVIMVPDGVKDGVVHVYTITRAAS